MDALVDLGQKLEIDPDDVENRRLRSEVHFGMGNYNSSILDLNQVILRSHKSIQKFEATVSNGNSIQSWGSWKIGDG